ncbi:YhcN/YlaJ family sporulation lipoprotein [Halobacillus yeomjeoni]|uniref:YhcN/YlaJ family sporulation lipoprotein n=1 Tax=Halobacillus yeomjeoni TaxID=311194 RepID=A0A931HWA2_9BACI|nr:YhcN/YlaJ family sporulation lipoprotein [Halobacillus yeomjeoni]MBH0231032.1 YhcN/YlaJ family sporulation lipoprotein [Halobacillus yeomjeoni]MCA0984524.1 YhcN/YlaJ family sporulation lipoprotein [Halobacillus yeomjeoni]
MKNIINICLILGLILLFASGCAENAKEETKMQEDTLNGNAMDSYEDELMDGQVGYVRFKKDQLDQRVEKNRVIKVNREQVADMISRMILRYEGFEDVATLVTDNEVLIAYQKPENHSREEAADMVQKTAYSMVPSFYHVYVSDDPASFGDIQSVSTSTVYDEEYKEVIDSIVQKLKKSPQGKVPENNMNQPDVGPNMDMTNKRDH